MSRNAQNLPINYMDCRLSCSVGIVFVIASVAITFAGPVGNHKQLFYASLSSAQRIAYDKVVSARRAIYLQGLGLGLLLSFVLLSQVKSKDSFTIPCAAAAITLVTNYLFYTLSPKPQSTVISLNSKKQRVLWYNIYRHMQFVYHGGLVLGIIAAYFLASSLCSYKKARQ